MLRRLLWPACKRRRGKAEAGCAPVIGKKGSPRTTEDIQPRRQAGDCNGPEAKLHFYPIERMSV
jgi:hypothetical protein